MKTIKILAYWLLVIGGLNWLLMGVFGWDISRWLGDSISRVIYIIVGVSAIIGLFGCGKCSCDGSPKA